MTIGIYYLSAKHLYRYRFNIATFPVGNNIPQTIQFVRVDIQLAGLNLIQSYVK